ncbi:uncharacterized protein [Mytilus edulis]|uniref:uncharacterized protein n=1 Tax=Mytilus edulis TaxID=6550 RepID=UPI0039EE733B
MYCVSCLVIFAVVVSTSEFHSSEKAHERSNIDKGLTSERLRRSLYQSGPGNKEYLFFLHYFQAINRENAYIMSIHNSRIQNWGPAFGIITMFISYDMAIRRITNHYKNYVTEDVRNAALQEIGSIIYYRESQGIKHGGLDSAHQRILDLWMIAKHSLQS